MKEKKDVVIIGGGIAGCFMAYWHLVNNKTVTLIDHEIKNSSSKVAAGLFNPLMLKHFTKSWYAEELFPFLEKFYPKLEHFLKASFYHPTGIVKLFSNTLEQNKWIEASDHFKTKSFVSLQKKSLPSSISQAHSHGFVNHSGWVDTANFISEMKKTLAKQYLNCNLSYNSINITNKEVNITVNNKKISAKNIVFCEGIQAQKNPFFNKIKFTPTGGEVLTIESNVKLSQIVHRGGFIVPLSESRYKVGTTYKKEDPFLEQPTLEGTNELLNIANGILKTPFNIEQQLIGTRPNVYDRRPILGAHQEYKNAFILNGLGSKGVSLGPYFSKMLYKNMYNLKKIPMEVNYMRFIDRFKS